MTSYYVIVLIKLYKEIGNDEYISVCNFGDRRMSCFEVIEGEPPWVPLSQEAKNQVSVGLKNIGNEQSTPR